LPAIVYFVIPQMSQPAYAQNETTEVDDQSAIGLTQAECKAKGMIVLNIWVGTWCVKDLAQYIRIFYQFFIGIIGIFAVAMMMFSGFKRITASGNPEKINTAKDHFTSAIVGVVIALISFILLRLINPAIVELQMPTLATVTGMDATHNYCSSYPDDIRFGEDRGTKQRIVGVNSSNAYEGMCNQSYVVNNKKGEAEGSCDGTKCVNPRDICMWIGSYYDCRDPEKYCTNTYKDDCKAADEVIARKNPDKGCAKRVDNEVWFSLLMIQLPNFGSEDQCVYSDVIKLRDGYERISCFDPEARDTCWGVSQESGQIPGDCHKRFLLDPDGLIIMKVSGSSHLCTDNPRAIKGAGAMCIRRTSDDVVCCDDGEGVICND
ncbi:pilin, partial [Patescibacteria group bacterium]|nr:pilin [Patescibacteria group bacterium]MBU1890539.1 pilin [Patescibacteria group bacterium]